MLHTIRIAFSALILLGVSACTGGQTAESYCGGYELTAQTEYQKCLDYYHTQTAAFAADRDLCELKADEVYPPSLYDRGGYGHTHGGFGSHGGWYGGHTIRIDPDWHHNREVDRLRMRIIEPCMQQKGWHSGRDWQAGRHPVGKVPAAKPVKPLPWQR